ncbi:phosphoserine phosphatase SerB [Ferrovum sp. PN-J185]|uniref:phosphoserine phosphatase SerB n=1 Tax=Ferrovum sp. PN-J185 TaxID=1356306 RepID=UPI0007980485|nr:phosphoserine phosphatase SerB [Ferrovum sp. PN-J185]KXW56487.1 phosphoserine phosphatase [Ferrovum sp. PN-J185]MCC6068164.1 phosphoserine phosphatase SerB [Ferrovum sp. PN-J185]MDE1891723.1 phosphoserine phosphatase SerB [Betaproteobacteria bacterium]MDE2056435.1 phosphoserine phosphatase SerB [Betaproteobacteria bacterium]
MSIFQTVVQSSQPLSSDVLAQLAKFNSYRLVNDRLIYLPTTPLTSQLSELANLHQLDIAQVPNHRSFSDISLVVMDMDSTLITIECIDEIADFMGIKDQVSAITESAMRGEIDFSESLRRRVSLLEGLPETTLLTVYNERLKITSGAEQLLQALRDNGIETLLVSGGFTFFTERLQKRLNLTHTRANTLEVKQGYLTGRVLGDIVDAQGKAYWLRTLLKQQKNPKGVVAIGDGANDLAMMKEADISVAFHAKPIVREQATHALSWVGLDGVIPLLEIQ